MQPPLPSRMLAEIMKGDYIEFGQNVWPKQVLLGQYGQNGLKLASVPCYFQLCELYYISNVRRSRATKEAERS